MEKEILFRRSAPTMSAVCCGRPNFMQRVRHARPARSRSEELRAIEDKAIRDAVRLQEDLGYRAVTDGEFRRAYWHIDFLTQFDNAVAVPPNVKARFHTETGDIEAQPPGIRVVGKLARSKFIVGDDFAFLKSVTKVTPKVTIPSPSNMHFRGGRAAIDQSAYPDMAEFYADLARIYAEEVASLGAAGCTYLQVDEVFLAYLCDPKLPVSRHRSARIKCSGHSRPKPRNAQLRRTEGAVRLAIGGSRAAPGFMKAIRYVRSVKTRTRCPRPMRS